MRKVIVAFAACMLVAVPAAADAPAYLPVQGVLSNTDGTPVDGDMTMRFGLYTADMGGTEVWNETQTVSVDQGFFTAYLGDVTTLGLALFRDNDGLWLGVRVGTDSEMARFQIATTGYAAFAQYAGDAETLGGTPASGFLTSSSGVAWGSITGIPAGFADGNDDGTTYTAGTGLTLSGSTFAADQATIQGWAQAVCYDTEAELTAVLNDNYAPLTHTHAWGSITGVPAGFADGTDNDTTYTAGAGLTLTGTAFAVNGVTSAMITDGTIGTNDTFLFTSGVVSSTTATVLRHHYFDTLNGITGFRVVVAANGATGGAGTLTVRRNSSTCTGGTVSWTQALAAGCGSGCVSWTYISPVLTVTAGEQWAFCVAATAATAPVQINWLSIEP